MVFVVVHYSEIGTKGKNRTYFENILVRNIKNSFREKLKKVFKRYGRIVCEFNDFVEKNEIMKGLSVIPGIANFSFAEVSSKNLEDIQNKSLQIMKNLFFSSFKVHTTRSDKSFHLNSLQINETIGDFLSKCLEKKVNLSSPDVTLFIEIGEKEVFLYTEKIKGIGGLPVGASGKVLCSLSGGIDSPVASYLMMKRGCKVHFVHFFNELEKHKGAYQSKINEIVSILTKFQGKSKLFLVPFGEIQKEIIIHCPSEYRMILYRRVMIKILNLLAKREKAKAIVTGDNLGQVASQTLENLRCIYSLSDFPIIHPLIGFNKEEIIELAKKIGTYSSSIKDYVDCCSFLISKHPSTKTSYERIKHIESNIKEMENLIERAINEMKCVTF
ncbi:MAG: tRNA uracil 4-sulfurtransferase ThiI [Candidatus Pacearchaeota archaeon]